MPASRHSLGHQYLAAAATWIAVFACCVASTSTALADCGPGSPPDCTCVRIGVVNEVGVIEYIPLIPSIPIGEYPILVLPYDPYAVIPNSSPSTFVPPPDLPPIVFPVHPALHAGGYPWNTMPAYEIPEASPVISSYAGTLELNLPQIISSPNTFLVAPEIPAPERTIIGPSFVETFILHTQSPIELPTFPTLHLVNHEILPTSPWTPSGVLEHNATLTVVLPDMNYLLPAVPEPSTLLLLTLAAASTFARRRPTRITNPKI